MICRLLFELRYQTVTRDHLTTLVQVYLRLTLLQQCIIHTLSTIPCATRRSEGSSFLVLTKHFYKPQSTKHQTLNKNLEPTDNMFLSATPTA